MKEIPIWEKSNLTLEEAAAYSGIGINKLRKLTNDEQCQFVLWVGSKRLIKRKKLDEYIERMYSIGPVDKCQKTAETRSGPGRIGNMQIEKDGACHPFKV